MSFPEYLVRVRRHCSISVEWQDMQGGSYLWPDLPTSTSELLQHEIDHLDGITSFQRMQDGQSVVHVSQYLARLPEMRKMVDYVIDRPDSSQSL